MNLPMAGTLVRQLLCRRGLSAAVSQLGLHSPHTRLTDTLQPPYREIDSYSWKPRGFHASGKKPLEYSNHYIHAKTMYNLKKIKGRKLKFGIGVFGGVAMGTFVPIFAVCFQQSKAASAGAK